MSKETDLKFAFIGATGRVGRSLRHLGVFGDDAVWIGRSNPDGYAYTAIDSYEPEVLKSHIKDCDVLVLLAAITRDGDSERLTEANVRLPCRLAADYLAQKPDGRVIFLSSDLAAYPEVPYGASKASAEEALLALGGDVVCLRASMIACDGVCLAGSSLDAMNDMSKKSMAPMIGDGQFPIRPLWSRDLAAAILALGSRRGSMDDSKCWSIFGESMNYRDVLLGLGARHKNRPKLLPMPIFPLRLVGRALRLLNARTTFPIDFLDAVALGPRLQPDDLFSHIGVTPSGIEQILDAISAPVSRTG